MGIQGLLPFLKEASTQINVSELRNYTIAIDSYCWLHKGAFGCAEKLARGEETNGYVLYCLKYIKMLQQYNIRPILVFDGQHLPAKKATEEKRRQQRQQNKKQAQELLRLGKASEAYSYIRRSIDITHKMALNLIKECRNLGIDCIVAPYEADAQLAYLNMSGICQAVISEDSDLVLFGCKKIVYKLDLLQETATLVNAEKVPICMKLRPDVYNFDKFRYMCILSGCDYLESLPGVGIKKALKFITMTANPSIYDVLPKLPSYLKLKDVVVTNEYRNEFMIADATFRHQIVYDPIQRKLVHLTDPSLVGTKEEYLINAGEMYDLDLAFNMALGNVDPFSLKKLDNWEPNGKNINKNSIWAEVYKKPELVTKLSMFTTETKIKEYKVKAITNDEIEKQKLEEDFQLDTELQTYLLKDTSTKRKRVSENEDSPDTAPMSPVLKKEIFNPFKKISKFNRTEIHTSEVKVSRYFLRKDLKNQTNGTSDTSVKEENGEEIDMNNSISLVEEEQVVSEEENIQTSPTYNRLSSLRNQRTVILNSNKLAMFAHKNSKSTMTHRPSNESANETSNLENLTPPDNQNGEEIIDLVQCETVANIVEKSVIVPTLRRTRSESSATNAKKQTNLPKNQRTLLSMFKFSKPPTLS